MVNVYIPAMHVHALRLSLKGHHGVLELPSYVLRHDSLIQSPLHVNWPGVARSWIHFPILILTRPCCHAVLKAQ